MKAGGESKPSPVMYLVLIVATFAALALATLLTWPQICSHFF